MFTGHEEKTVLDHAAAAHAIYDAMSFVGVQSSVSLNYAMHLDI